MSRGVACPLLRGTVPIPGQSGCPTVLLLVLCVEAPGPEADTSRSIQAGNRGYDLALNGRRSKVRLPWQSNRSEWDGDTPR
jgi:hypothetical protein